MQYKLFILFVTIYLSISLCTSCENNKDDSEPFKNSILISKKESFQLKIPSINNNNLHLISQSVLKIAIISDLNSSYGSLTYKPSVYKAINKIKALKPDLVVSTGDLVAGQKEGLDYDAMWKSFHYSVSDPLFDNNIPFVTAPGNHDASGYPQYYKERESFREAWKYRKPPFEFVEKSNFPFYFAFIVQETLFIILDLTVANTIDKTQLQWLENILQQYKDIRNKVAFGHLPIFPVSPIKSWEVLILTPIEYIFKKYKLTAYFSGHHHAYYPGKVDDLRLISVGSLGDAPRALLNDSRIISSSFVWMEISPQKGILKLEAYTGENFDEIIPRSSLPTNIGHLLRDDMTFSSYIFDELDRLATHPIID